MGSPTKFPSESRGMQTHYARFILNTFFGVLLAFPLGIITACIEAVSLFGTILPISILFAVIFPIVVPLITISGVFLASWHLITFGMHTLIGTGKSVAGLANGNVLVLQTVHVLWHAHEIAYMGIYGLLVIFNVKPVATEPDANVSPFPSNRCQTRTRLFIHDFPKLSIPVFPPTPPYSYIPSRSPTCTESTDTSFTFRTPADEPTHTSLVQLSNLLDTLKEEELSIVASYVAILKRGSSSSLG